MTGGGSEDEKQVGVIFRWRKRRWSQVVLKFLDKGDWSQGSKKVA